MDYRRGPRIQLQAKRNIVAIRRGVVTTVLICDWGVTIPRAELGQVASYILM